MLNSKQEQVANHKSGHAKVLAAAGSGKSTTMIERVKRLVSDGVSSRNILSVMFNRDARDSYRDKLLQSFDRAQCPPVFTFHGLGSTIQNKLIESGDFRKCRLETSEYKLFMFARDTLMPWISDVKAKKQIVMEFLSYVDLAKNSLDAPLDVFSEYRFATKYRYFIDGFKAFEKNERRRIFSSLAI